MAVEQIPTPDGANCYGGNGILNLSYFDKIVKACNRQFKVSVDPKVTDPKIDVSDNDVTLTLPPSATGLPTPPDPSKAYMLVWDAKATAWRLSQAPDNVSIWVPVCVLGTWGYYELNNC